MKSNPMLYSVSGVWKALGRSSNHGASPRPAALGGSFVHVVNARPAGGSPLGLDRRPGAFWCTGGLSGSNSSFD